MHPTTSFFRPQASIIGLIADTHVPDRSASLNPRILNAFKSVHLILHAGDISSPIVLDELRRIADTIAVRGNNLGDNRRFPISLPYKTIIEVNRGIRIGLFHGVETFYQRITDVAIGRSGFTSACTHRILKRVKPIFPEVECTVFGHSHWPVIHFDGTRLFVNPGKAFGSKENTIGIMEIHQGEVRVKILPLGTVGRLSAIVSKWHTFPL
jgi:putative phosphoesterase